MILKVKEFQQRNAFSFMLSILDQWQPTLRFVENLYNSNWIEKFSGKENNFLSVFITFSVTDIRVFHYITQDFLQIFVYFL